MDVAVATAEECRIPGLSMLPNFVTAEEEETMLRAVDSRPWEPLARRRVQHYGRAFDYTTRRVDLDRPARPIPPELHEVLRRLQALPGVGPLDQLTVNEYAPGVGLSPHVDTHSAFGDAIVSLSLAGPCVMTLLQRGGRRESLLLPPRSALVLAGEARLAWEHYIPHRKSDVLRGGRVVPRATRRVSLTLRRARSDPCACAWPLQCDSQQGSIPPTRAAALKEAARAAGDAGLPAGTGGDACRQSAASCPGDVHADVADATAAPSSQAGAVGGGSREPAAAFLRLEEEHVVQVYDAIAGHFSSTRFSVWPRVRQFIDALPTGALVADVGCGNGKYFSVRRDIYVSGSDRSTGLAQVAARRLRPTAASSPPPLADVAVCDALRLPYRLASCDAVLCIAVLHHLTTTTRRVALLAQLARALAPGGRALVTVWATEQENMKKVATWQPLRSADVPCGAGDTSGSVRQAAGAEMERAPVETQQAEGNPSQDYLVPWHLPLHRADAAAAADRAAVIDAAKHAIIFRRYYHLFGPGELEALVQQVGGCAVVDAFYDKDNWCVVFERVEEGRTPTLNNA